MTASHQKSHKSRTSQLLVALAATSGLFLAACDSGEPVDTVASSTVTKTTKATPEKKETSSEQPSEPSTKEAPDENPATVTSTERFQGNNDLHITEVRVGAHDGYDRVAIEFSGNAVPGWFASYSDQPVQQASGYPLEVVGDSYLEVTARGVTMEIPPSGFIYPVGPVEEVQPTGAIAGVTHGGVFEANGQFVIGIEGEPRAFTIDALTEPSRLVIDIHHP